MGFIEDWLIWFKFGRRLLLAPCMPRSFIASTSEPMFIDPCELASKFILGDMPPLMDAFPMPCMLAFPMLPWPGKRGDPGAFMPTMPPPAPALAPAPMPFSPAPAPAPIAPPKPGPIPIPGI